MEFRLPKDSDIGERIEMRTLRMCQDEWTINGTWYKDLVYLGKANLECGEVYVAYNSVLKLVTFYKEARVRL